MNYEILKFECNFTDILYLCQYYNHMRPRKKLMQIQNLNINIKHGQRILTIFSMFSMSE